MNAWIEEDAAFVSHCFRNLSSMEETSCERDVSSHGGESGGFHNRQPESGRSGRSEYPCHHTSQFQVHLVACMMP